MSNLEDRKIQENLTYATKVIKDLLRKEYGLDLGVPVKVNSRLRSTSAKVVYRKWGFKGDRGRGLEKCIPTHIDFNKRILMHSSQDYIKGVAGHEAVHYGLMVLGKPFKDGQAYFERELQRLGLPSNKGARDDSARVENKEYLTNETWYYVQCPNCEKVLKVWKRKPSKKSLADLSKYKSTCCRVDVEYAGAESAYKLLKKADK